MEAAALAGVEWVVSPIVTRLLIEGFSYLGGMGFSGISGRLDNLETTILPSQFQLVIGAAEKTGHKTKMERWLRKLKDALYEAEDMLDLYKYQILNEKVNDLNSNLIAKFYNKSVGIISSQKIKLRRSLTKLEMITAEAKIFCELLKIPIGDHMTAHGSSKGGGRSNVTTSLPPLKVFGRDKECDDIINNYLLAPSEASESGKSYSIVAIVGFGGAGKTTLAQKIYNDKRLEKEFDIKMWVTVSRRLDVFKHSREMIESASGHECPPLENWHMLTRKLIDLIKLKKVLLILDDVWCENSNEAKKWENFIAPFAKAEKRGSRILITTRTMNLPKVLHPRYTMMLHHLEEDAIVSLFNHHAFYGANSNNSDPQWQLEDIGKQIVQKLHGSPLAAEAVGSRLSKKLEASYWREALEGNYLRDARRALLWSFQCLDAPLQRCFSFFSLFPKGTSYDSDKMIRMWIAEGFINSWNDSRRLEDIGREYFDELVSKSFLKHGEDDHKYYMHDLLHDLAENISKEDCLRIEDEHVGEIPQTIRHLYVSDESLWENILSLNKLKNLRTLIIYVTLGSGATDHLFAAAMKKYKKLRVLQINGESIETLPESIGDLKHLRYLDLYGNDKLVELPASLGKLYHLQLLSLPRGANLPRSLKNLINLRHFGKNCKALRRVPYIGRLTSLETLEQFDVGKKKGYDIGQLKNLNEIRGELTISCLENVGGNNKAAEASLEDKIHLESLSLEWSNFVDDSDCRRDLDLEVLGGLQPHPNLTKLTIKGYKSLGYPNWLLQEGCLQNLGSLYFHNCTSLEVLPDTSILFPRCHKLEIWNLPNLKKFPLLPQSLKILVIIKCPSLVFFSKEELQEGREKIELILPLSLQELKIHACDITDRALSQLLRSLASLKCLELEEINTITTLPSEEILQHLISLTQLEIIGCSQLKSLGGLYALPSLDILKIKGVHSLELEILPSGEGGGRGILPPSLRSLYIRGWTGPPDCLSTLLSYLPNSLDMLNLQNCHGNLSLPEHLPELLSELWLSDCPGITSLPDLPVSLTVIAIIECPVLEKCRSPDGEDWPKIANIPQTYIHTAETDLSEDIA